MVDQRYRRVCKLDNKKKKEKRKVASGSDGGTTEDSKP
jgi:hypothetical protein